MSACDGFCGFVEKPQKVAGISFSNGGGGIAQQALKCPKNLRCLCIGASESGKSTWIASLIKNKEKVIQSPGYAKFIFCSPNIKADTTQTAARDLRYKDFLEECAKPSEIVFFDHVFCYVY